MYPNRRYKWRIAIILGLLAVYLASFLLVRKTVILDYFAIDSQPGKGTCLVVHYFSKNQLVNSFVYCLYYPLHAPFGGDEREIAQADWVEHPPHNKTIYVKDLGVLYGQGVVGFDSK